ncbi:MAG TPA: alpha/beta fold hydrolase, partial [Acidimicrobiia bacterium]|nr:alpha/beta fold hydrolase [Acidimicrobiia bacterium]
MAIPVQFVTTSDGVRIAYAVHGDGPPLVLVRGWITHLDLMWQEPAFRRFFEALGERFRVVRFDARGNGLSQRDVGPPDLDGFVRDTEAVVQACELDHFVLWGSCFGGPIAIAYAARHRERVDRIILEGTYPTWVDMRTPKQRTIALDLMRMLSTS